MKNKITIVGPKPEKDKSLFGKRSVKIEALLLMAKYNKSFRKELLYHRQEAITNSNIDLSENEKTLLMSIDSRQLQNTIQSFQIPGVKRSSLANWKTAAAVLVLLTTMAVREGKTQNVSVDTIPGEESQIVQGIVSEKFYRTISGKVVDPDLQLPIVDVSISIKGTSESTKTDWEGEYKIQTMYTDTLVYRKKGYVTQEIPCSGYAIVNIMLIKIPQKEDK